ncbi:MAG: cupin domain-containing protein [Anaerolineales bacterium]|nr:MAG: cupin domain-containing protein [Anaerolineales bacterium]
MSDEKPWEPPAIPAEQFHLPDQWTNINRAPHDVISGVIYKPALNIKSVRYEPLDAAPDMPEMWQGQGGAIVRWLFSESPGTEERIMTGAEFLFLQDIMLDPAASGGQRRHPGEDHLLYVISGEGTLYHRACLGCPVVSRSLRVGDAALVQDGEFYNIENHLDDAPFRVLLVGFRKS